MLIEMVNIKISKEKNMFVAIVKYRYDGTKQSEQATQALTMPELYENITDLMKIRLEELKKID